MTVAPRRVSRRTVIAATAGGLAVTGLGASGRPAPAAHPGGRLRPVSMAMHIHGPFSEGIASFEAHLAQARRTDVDVVWWTDHDFRVAAHDHRRAVDFNGPSEPDGQLSWTWAPLTEGSLAAASADFVDAGAAPGGTTPPPRPTGAPPAGYALRLAATGGAETGGIFWYAATAWNYSYSTCIADTTLELDVRPEALPTGGAVVLQMELSYHPERGGLPAGQYVLRYRIGGPGPRRHVADGLLGTVELPGRPGRWRRWRLDLVADVRRLWPRLVAEDNSLRNLRVGVQAPAAGLTRADVDRLRFHRARRKGQAGEDLRRDVLARYRHEYADVAHYRAYEVSMTRHLNWYGGDLTLPSFPSPPLRDNDPALAASMVDFLHAHGGIVCWNHPMDVESRESLARLMIERNALGVDLVEIGRNPLADLLWVLDVAARNALFFTAVGASDDHGGQDWLADDERWITYAWAGSTGVRDLVEALRMGRAWFADPVAYRGSLDLRIQDRTAMGSVSITGDPVVPVDVVATDLPADASLEVITGTVDRAGVADLAPATEVRALRSVLFAAGAFRLPVPVGSGTYVRTQVRAADGAVIAVSNPLWLLPDEPPGGVPDGRSLRR